MSHDLPGYATDPTRATVEADPCRPCHWAKSFCPGSPNDLAAELMSGHGGHGLR